MRRIASNWLAALGMAWAAGAAAAHAAFTGPPLLVVGSAIADPGERASISVSLLAGGTVVVAAQNDLLFDALHTPIAANPRGAPDCTVNPAIRKGATTFAFQPFGCVPPACSSMRALVYSLDNYDPIPNGTLVYSCRLDVAADAVPGIYPIEAANLFLSNPLGGRIDAAEAVNGQIVVPGIPPEPTPSRSPSSTATASPPPSATHTPTDTPRPTATGTPSFSPTPTLTRTPSSTRTPSLTRTPTRSRTPSPTWTPTPTRTATPTRTSTPTRTATVTPTHSATPPPPPSAIPTATQSATPSPPPTPSATPSQSPNPTSTSSSTPTASSTPTTTSTSTGTPTSTIPPVRLAVGSARAIPGGHVRIPVRLSSAPFPTVATANDLSFRNDLFRIEPGDCRLEPGLDKSLLVSILPDAGDANRTTLRAFVRALGAAAVLPDGAIYSCHVEILAATPPGTYPILNGEGAAFDAAGTAYVHVESTPGNIVVSLVTSCPADCNYDGAVTVDELLAAVNAGLGLPGACAAADADGDGTVGVDDLIAAVNAALTGCSPPAP